MNVNQLGYNKTSSKHFAMIVTYSLFEKRFCSNMEHEVLASPRRSSDIGLFCLSLSDFERFCISFVDCEMIYYSYEQELSAPLSQASFSFSLPSIASFDTQTFIVQSSPPLHISCSCFLPVLLSNLSFLSFSKADRCSSSSGLLQSTTDHFFILATSRSSTSPSPAAPAVLHFAHFSCPLPVS